MITSAQYRAMTAQQIKQPKKRKQNPEYKLQKAFVQHMAVYHPGIIVFSDAAAHVAKTALQQIRANALQTKGEKQPDMFVAVPSGEYAGLFIEWKSDSPYKKDGATLLKNEHIEAQQKTMHRLIQAGYAACFCWSVEMGIETINAYLNGEKIPKP